MCCSDYFACVFAAIWSIVQSIAHLGWCVWGTHFYECRYELDDRTFKYFWYLTYFYTNSCTNATLDNLLSAGEPNKTMKNNLDIESMQFLTNKSSIEFPPESAVAGRTYNIFMTFIFVDSLWIIAAVGLLIGACYQIRENWAIIFYFPWSIILLFILFFDGVAAGWYGIDISYNYGATNWFFFIGGQNQTGLDQINDKVPNGFPILPSILMMFFFSRFFIVWFINLFLFFRVVQASVNAVENIDDDEYNESKHSHQGQLEESNVVNNQRPRNFQVREINLNSSSARIRRWQLYYGTDEDDDEEKRDQAVRRHSRRNSKQRHQKANENWYKNNTFQGSGPNLAVIGGYEGDRSTSPSPLPHYDKKQIRNPCNNLYSSGYESNDMYFSYEEHQGSSPSISSDYAEICDNRRNGENYDELRGQLPWSYFQGRNDQLVPKRQSYNQAMPAVPVPDYTLRFSKDIKRVN